MADKITVSTVVSVPSERAWVLFTRPEHITKWNHASDDWHSPRASNDLVVGGKFNFRLESVDGSKGFDFTGVYDEVALNYKIAYTITGGRKVDVNFERQGNSTKIVTNFDPESENTPEVQQSGWQAILDNFKKYAESQ